MFKFFAGLYVLLAVTHFAFAQEGNPSSNADQGAAVGMADVIRASGMAQLLSSQAVTQGEATRQLYLQNQSRAIQGYLDLRRYNRESRAAQRSSPLSLEQYVRESRQLAPDRLTASQLDPLTGRIEWPGPLKKPEYEQLRRRLERLFEERATGLTVHGEVRAATTRFLAQLQADVHTMTANDYMVARRFLESLQDVSRVIEQ